MWPENRLASARWGERTRDRDKLRVSLNNQFLHWEYIFLHVLRTSSMWLGFSSISLSQPQGVQLLVVLQKAKCILHQKDWILNGSFGQQSRTAAMRKCHLSSVRDSSELQCQCCCIERPQPPTSVNRKLRFLALWSYPQMVKISFQQSIGLGLLFCVDLILCFEMHLETWRPLSKNLIDCEVLRARVMVVRNNHPRIFLPPSCDNVTLLPTAAQAGGLWSIRNLCRAKWLKTYNFDG